jgi:hypothetical protein
MPLNYRRMPIEDESPERPKIMGYEAIRCDLAERNICDRNQCCMS